MGDDSDVVVVTSVPITLPIRVREDGLITSIWLCVTTTIPEVGVVMLSASSTLTFIFTTWAGSTRCTVAIFLVNTSCGASLPLPICMVCSYTASCEIDDVLLL